MNSIIQQLNSKKFRALVGAVIVVMNADNVPGLWAMSSLTVQAIVALVLGYMGAQGVADHGKESAKEIQGI